jgi:hypothetical protein
MLARGNTVPFLTGKASLQKLSLKYKSCSNNYNMMLAADDLAEWLF